MGYDTKTEGVAVWYIPCNGNENERGKAMLLNEQIFLSFLPLLAGAGIGIAATAMFVRLISIIYLPQKHNIGVNVYIYQSDMLELAGVLFVAVAVCYVVISRLLKSMKIAQALRLGEDS